MNIDKRIIDKYGHLKNIDFKDSIIKNKDKNPQRFYRTFCTKCFKDRGYIEPKDFIKLCISCTKIKHSKNIANIDYNNFIKEKGKPVKYKMSCIICNGDKGYKPIAYHNRRCHKCSNEYISKIRTKLTPEHRKIRHAFSVCLSSRLNKRQGSKTGNSTFDILGYTFEELIIHLEKQFEPWMNWDNYGIHDLNKRTWQIDHILPDSSFIYKNINDDGFKKSWSLNNLRPLCAKENVLKSDNITEI